MRICFPPSPIENFLTTMCVRQIFKKWKIAHTSHQESHKENIHKSLYEQISHAFNFNQQIMREKNSFSNFFFFDNSKCTQTLEEMRKKINYSPLYIHFKLIFKRLKEKSFSLK